MCDGDCLLCRADLWFTGMLAMSFVASLLLPTGHKWQRIAEFPADFLKRLQNHSSTSGHKQGD